MDHEKTFTLEEKDVYRYKLKAVCENVRKNLRGAAYYAETKEDALNIVKDLIESFNAELENGCRTIGIGDSLSVHQIGFFDWISENRFNVINPFERLPDGRFSEFKGYPNDWLEKDVYDSIMNRVWEKARQALISDVFVAGANSITYDGTIINSDSMGNRVAGIIFGPYKVVLVIGRNKVVTDETAAIDRIRNVAAPLNHYRHYMKHRIQGEKAKENYGIYKFGELPCVKTGKCIDCNSPICSRHVTMIMNKATARFYKNRLHVILVNEDLGC